jgi:hypothetical protein
MPDKKIGDMPELTSPATDDYILVSDGSGTSKKAQIGNLPGGAGGGDLVDDTTPQLGGDLDTNGFGITRNIGGLGEDFYIYDTANVQRVMDVDGTGNIRFNPSNRFQIGSTGNPTQYMNLNWNGPTFQIGVAAGSGGVPSVSVSGFGSAGGGTVGWNFNCNTAIAGRRLMFGPASMTEYVDAYYDGTDLIFDAANADAGGSDVKFQNFTDVQIGTDSVAASSGTTGGTGSAGAGNQYVELNIGGTVYKVLHDGTV